MQSKQRAIVHEVRDSEGAASAAYTRIILNFPPDLAQRIKQMAAVERRSLTAQIQVLVEQALRQDEVAA